VSYGLLLLRLFVGLAFVGHGTQKLFGWFGGYGPQGTGGFFASQGYRAGVLMAIAAGVCEAGGGALLALGFLTPLACALIAVVMINAIGAVTFKRGFMLGPSSSSRTSLLRFRLQQPGRDASRSTAPPVGTTPFQALSAASSRSALPHWSPC
jgi:putative oxidoreductase